MAISPQFILTLPEIRSSTSRVIFSDINFRSSAIGDDDLALNMRSISHSIMTILSTYKKQRLFHPTFGANLEKYLFDPVDEITADNLKNEIFNSISDWEPNVQVRKSDVIVTPFLDEEYYIVELKFSVPRLESAGQLTFSLTKSRL